MTELPPWPEPGYQGPPPQPGNPLRLRSLLLELSLLAMAVVLLALTGGGKSTLSFVVIYSVCAGIRIRRKHLKWQRWMHEH